MGQTLSRSPATPQKQLQLPWIPARHGSNDFSQMRTAVTQIRTQSTPPSPSHLAHTPLSWVGWKEIHRQRDSTAYSRCTPSCCYISHKTNAPQQRVSPPRFPSEKQWNQVNLFGAALEHCYISLIQPLSRRRTTSSPRIDSISGQHPEHPHASQAAASPT